MCKWCFLSVGFATLSFTTLELANGASESWPSVLGFLTRLHMLAPSEQRYLQLVCIQYTCMYMFGYIYTHTHIHTHIYNLYLVEVETMTQGLSQSECCCANNTYIHTHTHIVCVHFSDEELSCLVVRNYRFEDPKQRNPMVPQRLSTRCRAKPWPAMVPRSWVWDECVNSRWEAVQSLMGGRESFCDGE